MQKASISRVGRFSRSRAFIVTLHLLLVGLLTGGIFGSSVAYSQTDSVFLPFISRGDAPAVDVRGSVFVQPPQVAEEQARLEAERQPIEYVVLLDTSGSMNWNFDGQAHRQGKVVECTGSSQNSNYARRRCGRAQWDVVEERRIYIAKQAITNFIDLMEPDDAMQIIGFSSRDYTMAPSGSRQLGTEAGKELLQQAVLEAGSLRDPYEVAGGTTTATALRKARSLMAEAPEMAPDGQPYRQAVILLTDGLANYFVEKVDVPWGPDQWYNRARDIPACARDPLSGERVECQVGYVQPDGVIPRPITAMIEEGETLRNEGVEVYAMMMAGANTTGLPEIASAEEFPWFSEAKEPEQVQTNLMAINELIENSPSEPDRCGPPSDDWMDTINPANSPDPLPDYPDLGDAVFGYVELYDDTGTLLRTAPITLDVSSGTLAYFFEDVPAGTYNLRAWISLKWADGTEHRYQHLFNPDDATYALQVSFTVTIPGTGDTVIVGPPVYLAIVDEACLAPPVDPTPTATPDVPVDPSPTMAVPIDPSPTTDVPVDSTPTTAVPIDPTATPTVQLPPQEQLGLKGNVFFRQQSAEIEELSNPVDYVVLLDTSGSMNWNFAGQAHKGGRPVQCGYNPATPDVPLVNCGGSPWDVVEERRIYVAKQGIMQLIDKIEPEDAMTIIGFSSNDYAMRPSERQFGTPEGKAALRQAVLDAGQRSSDQADPYLVGGGTTTPRALLKAREVIAGLPEQAPDGEDYKRVALLLTDGIPNHFDARYNVPWRKGYQWFNEAKDDPMCRGIPNVGESVECQTGFVNDDPSGIMRPITSMVYHGEQLQSEEVVVYAMMIGPAETTGLDRVASRPMLPWFSRASQPSDITNILDAIDYGLPEMGQCTPILGDWQDSIAPENSPASAPPFGYVYLYGEDNTLQHEVPIVHDEVTGKLTYTVTDIAPGTYWAEAWIHYTGDDGVTRQYSRLFDIETLMPQPFVTIVVDPTDVPVIVGPDLYLDLDGNVCLQ